MYYIMHAGIYLLLLLCTVACQDLSPLIHPSPTVTPAQNRSLDGYAEERWTLTSPDGRWRAEGLVAAPDNSGDEYYVELRLLQTNGSQTLATVWTPMAEWRPFGLGYTVPRLVYWSKDGRYLYYTNAPHPDGCALFVNASDLWQLDLSTGTVHEVLPPSATWVLDAAPDGTIAYLAQQTIVFFELNNDTRGEIPLELEQANVQLGNLVWSSDSQRVAFTVAYDPCIPSSWQHAIYIADRQQLTTTLAWPPDDRRLQVERWLDDDHLLLVDREDNKFVLDLTSGNLAPSGSAHVVELLTELPLIEQPGYEAAWSPDGNYLLLAAPEPQTVKPQSFIDRALFVFELATGQVKQLPDMGYRPLWSPDGRVLLVNSGDVMDGTFAQWLYLPEKPEAQVAIAGYPAVPSQWLRDGRLVYHRAEGLYTTPLIVPFEGDATGSNFVLPEPELWFSYAEEEYEQAWPSPAGDAILHIQRLGNTEHQLSLVQTNGEVRQFANQPDGLGVCCVWGPDGTHLVFSSYKPDYGLYLVDSMGEDRQLLVAGGAMGPGRFLAMTFAPDGETIAFTWQREDQEYFQDTQLYLVETDGTNLRQLTANGSGSHQWPQWSPTENLILTQRAVSGGFALWLTVLAPATTSPLQTLMIEQPYATSSPELDTLQDVKEPFAFVVQATCPQQVDMAPPQLAADPRIADVQWTSFPVTIQDEPILLHRTGLPVRRLSLQETADDTTWLTVDMGSQPSTLIGSYWSQPYRRWNRPAIMQFDSVYAPLIGPVTITAPATSTTGPGQLVCDPPQAITIRGNPGWFLQQRSSHDSTWPAINTLIWYEDGGYWRVAALAPSAGGRYAAIDLIRLVQEEMATFDEQQREWQPRLK